MRAGVPCVKKLNAMRIITLIFILIIIPKFCWTQTINYQEIFGDAWDNAVVFEKDNRSWIEPILVKNNISYPLAIAVIFPELVRYSALRDKMEITLLKALYINLGDYYADFSIGHFQMKPSFAEIIRKQYNDLLPAKSEKLFKGSNEYENIRDFRSSIIYDMENTDTQLTYLIAFIKICEKKYKLNRRESIEKLRFLATAYNYGINKTASDIEKMEEKKFFNISLFRAENFCYADVSIFWYNKYLYQK